jgi:hypothetical protein
LRRIASTKTHRYRFTESLLPPYTILKALNDGTITEADWNELTAPGGAAVPSPPFDRPPAGQA